MSFGIILKKIRQDNNLTQEELAKKINTSRSNIANYENDRNFPSIDVLENLSRELHCSIDYLMGKSYYKNYEDFQQIEEFTLKKIKELNEDEIKKMTSLLNYINHNEIQDIDDFINTEISNFNSHNKLTLIKIISHLYYRYHGKIPEKFTAETINEVTAENWFDESKYIKKVNPDDSISYFSKIYMAPVYGTISAGIPNWAEECIEGRLPIDPELMNIVNPEECFFLRVNGESMNQLVKNGAYALIRKTEVVENGEIAVVLVDRDEATLKKFSKQGDVVVLEPMSNDPTFTTLIYNKDTEIKIIGKYIGKMEMK